jgi:hypothetical protein
MILSIASIVNGQPSTAAEPSGLEAGEMSDAVDRGQFSGDGPLWIWEPDRYVNFVRTAGPEPDARRLEKLSVAMAGNEFRDAVFTVGAPERDLLLDISLRLTGTTPWPAKAATVYVTEYLKNLRGDETGDALLPVRDPVSVPAGESRQFWIRFDTRTFDVASGTYPFELGIHDEREGLRRVLPGTVDVWDFRLPGYDVLSNNSYAIFLPKAEIARGELFREAVRHMKRYGLNHVFIEPHEVVRPTGLDENWKITGYEDQAVIDRITTSLDAWNEAPGDETLNFIFSICAFEELGLEREGYQFPNDRWKQVFAQYLDHFKQIPAWAGLNKDQWLLFLRDEADEEALKTIEIPYAEAIKSLDPTIRILCNTSTVLEDESWSRRLFDAFDVFQPHLGWNRPPEWLRASGKPVWVYQCRTGLTDLGKDLHRYYRGYAWDVLDQGYDGIGLWTYFSSNHDRAFYGEASQGCQLIFQHPEHGLVHSRRLEMFREGNDDYRYVITLRRTAGQLGTDAKQAADDLIEKAVRDVVSNPEDYKRPGKWRLRFAERILDLQSGGRL